MIIRPGDFFKENTETKRNDPSIEGVEEEMQLINSHPQHPSDSSQGPIMEFDLGTVVEIDHRDYHNMFETAEKANNIIHFICENIVGREEIVRQSFFAFRGMASRQTRRGGFRFPHRTLLITARGERPGDPGPSNFRLLANPA